MIIDFTEKREKVMIWLMKVKFLNKKKSHHCIIPTKVIYKTSNVNLTVTRRTFWYLDMKLRVNNLAIKQNNNFTFHEVFLLLFVFYLTTN